MSNQMNLTYELGRFSTKKGAFLAICSAFWEGKMSRMNVVFVWKTAVHWLTGYLLVPLPIGTGYCYWRIQLENKRRNAKKNLFHIGLMA